MQLIETIRAALQGKKTYIIAVLAIFSALLAFANGTASIFEVVNAILVATGLGTLRAGVTTEAGK